ncbi:MAG: NADH-quinone oxidoreductase subunit N [Chloroflexi bacterium]|nr:NADH-quinone oxidoreductase subunit N [Chloroflexota bacterium]MDA1240016.1 NADH-quinone oxidoreductase subunit N [Chloroflexota bacterium]MQC18962.1 NADH-quinone oxidoreductase subunit N [Chloroflexota bacterium]MQC48300.1 NADH-quinone oxidoreductase subunit N [Chloroflexota bacterium]
MTDVLGNALNLDFALLAPEIIIGLTALAIMFLDLFKQELKVGDRALPLLSVLGLLAAGAVSLFFVNQVDDFSRLIQVDNFTTFFRILFIGTTILVIVGSHEYVEKHVNHIGEFYALLLLSTVGAIYMAAARDLLTAYLAIEVLSFSLYVAVSLAKNDPRSGEAVLKYVLLGGVASAMLLYGLSLVYGVAGSTQYTEIATALAASDGSMDMALALGLVLIIGGLGFKASAVPFHMWTPDVYEGAPIPVTAYLSATSKAATFALILRWFAGPLYPVADEWRWAMATLAVATMVVGNLIALQQSNLKRLLAYSSIAQVGYMLMAITGLSSDTASALLVHLGGYLLTNLVVFIGVIHFYNRTGKEGIADLKGLAETNPYLALVLTAGLFSLAGMPLLVGFFTKFILFQAVVEADYLWLVVIGVIASTISLYYYLVVIKQMYLYEPEGDTSRWRISPTGYLTTGSLLGAVVVLGIWGTPLFRASHEAALALFAGV